MVGGRKRVSDQNEFDLVDPRGKTISELLGKEKPPEDKAFVIIQDGGTGDAICSTPMIESARKLYPDKKIIVGSSHHEVLINNPNIDKLYNLGWPLDLFDTWVKPLKHFGSVTKRDIYNENGHKLFPGKLSEIWCYMYNVPFYGDNVKIYLTEDEEIEAKNFLKSFPKQVVLIHVSSARLTFDPKTQITTNKDWFPERWTELVNTLNKTYDVVQVGGKEEPEISGVTTYLMGRTSMRTTAAIVKHCLSYICVESVIGHMGAAVDKPGVVLFGRSNPLIAGHEINENLYVPNSCEFQDLFCGRPSGYFGDSELYKGQMRPWMCPNRTCMRAITVPLVLQSFKKVLNKTKSK
jgi:ADP-heptose:LPS heptosyltransferase